MLHPASLITIQIPGYCTAAPGFACISALSSQSCWRKLVMCTGGLQPVCVPPVEAVSGQQGAGSHARQQGTGSDARQCSSQACLCSLTCALSLKPASLQHCYGTELDKAHAAQQ